ncbi:MAG: hypothetical protein RHS_5366 [Robinsoniella sp. RHS]|uniref:extracellular solute-binding protein n=1 Tax=Robinsoniella TaxID=588605 RepID=UPI0005C7D20C|nr:extracellular solute-binding protein [Robinsoniella peoriensis]KLU68801.1 MAG: hypothetical protein RHS_5366 [Robinsoniella sp. RHS]
MKKHVKAVSLLLSVTLTAGTLLMASGCGNGGSSGEAPDSEKSGGESTDSKGSDEEASDSAEGKSDDLVILNAWVGNALVSAATSVNQMDTEIGRLIAEKTGVAFNTTFLNSGTTADEAFNLMISGGGYEDYDVIMLPSSTTMSMTWQQKLVNSGAVVPIDEYLNQSDKYPNLASIPSEVMDLCKYENGSIYGYPHNWYEDMESKYGFWAADGWYIFPEYLEAVGMTSDDVKDLEGIETFLKAVKEKGLQNESGQTIQPMSMGEAGEWYRSLLTSFGVSTAGSGFHEVDGKMLHFRDHIKTMEAMKWMNRLYNQGLIDPEFITQKNDQLTEKIMTKRVGLVMTNAFNFWSAVTVGKNEASEMDILEYPLADGIEKAGAAAQYDPYGTPALYVTKSCKNPEAVAKLVDYFAEQGKYRQWELSYGPRGTTWDFDEELGEPYFQITDEKLIEAMNDYNAMTEYGYTTTVGVAPFDKDLNYYRKENEEQLFWIFNMHKSNSEVEGYAIKRPDSDRIQFSANGAYTTNFSILKQLDNDYFSRLVACGEAEFDTLWAEYQAQLEQQGHWSEVKAEFDTEYAKMK